MKKNPLALPTWASRLQLDTLNGYAARGMPWAWIGANGMAVGSAKTAEAARKAGKKWANQRARESSGTAPAFRVVSLAAEPLPTRTNSRRGYKREADRAEMRAREASRSLARMPDAQIGGDYWEARTRSAHVLERKAAAAARRAERGASRKRAQKWLKNPSNPTPAIRAFNKAFRHTYTTQDLAQDAIRAYGWKTGIAGMPRWFGDPDPEANQWTAAKMRGLADFLDSRGGLREHPYRDALRIEADKLDARTNPRRVQRNPYRGPLTISHEGPDVVIRHHEVVNPRRNPTGLFEIVVRNDRTGRDVLMTAYPVTHREATIIKSKMIPDTRRPKHLRTMIIPAGTANL